MIEPEEVHVLIIEDDEDDYFITRSLLARAASMQCLTEWARTYETGWEALRTERFDVCLADYRLGAHDGIELLRKAAEQSLRTPIILLTGQGDLEVDLQAMASGASDYLVKGATDAHGLERSIRYARERRRAEERIREQAALLDAARDAICAFSTDGALIYCNQSTERLTGYSVAEMKARNDLPFDVASMTRAREHCVREGAWMGELQLQTRDGRARTVESRWTLVRDPRGQASLLAISTDVTERKQLEAQFLRAQRMESIGRLVGGIAHDLGNLLVPVVLGVKVLQTRLAGDEKAMRTLSMIQKSAQRGSDMVKQVLAFARGVEGERVAMRVPEVIDEVCKIVEETFPVNIRVQTRVAPELPPVAGDATQLQQVVMNLAVNARDAMHDGGLLTIEAHTVTLDADTAGRNYEAQPGAYVCISVTDTGTGIPADVQDKIFEPFFTTKTVEKGTGLGLSTVYSITRSHGGFVTVYSEVGAGTTFSVYLPALPTALHAGIAGEAESLLPDGTDHHVLLVDDEPFILETARDVLEEAGYTVRTATNGREALDVLASGVPVDVIITDLMMPEMDGLALIRAVRALHPHLPIVAASGMMGERAREVVEAGANTFVSKPFTIARLATALHAARHGAAARIRPDVL